MTRVYPCIMRRDQYINVEIGEDGTPHLVELMPPQVNFRRLEAPTRADEKALRELEWLDLERQQFARSTFPAWRSEVSGDSRPLTFEDLRRLNDRDPR